MSDWNPNEYLQYRTERTRPSIDLISRIEFDEPGSIIDIGCGPGNGTRILRARWSGSRIVGLDSSAAMIEKARNDYPEIEWVTAEAGSYRPERKFDILFSNAAVQWMPDHDELLGTFRQLLSDRGLVAVQLPLFWDMLLGRAIDRISKEIRWSDKTGDVSSLFTIHTPSWYYDRLAALFFSVEVWQTDYLHVMDSHASIIEMIRSTGLRPYLARLDSDGLKKRFEEEILKRIRRDYPVQADGRILFPFKRLFFIARGPK